MRALGTSDITVSGLVLGGNVFGWTADRRTSFEILDAYVDAGGNSIDLADSYPHWAPGCTGGESERIVGEWMAARGNRADLVIATKVGKFPGNPGLSARQVAAGVAGSLQRLQSDYIDLYYCHQDDRQTPLEETFTALAEWTSAGVVRAIGASNYSADRLAQALRVSDRLGGPRFVALQPHYSLVVREEFEGELQALCEREAISCLPFWPLAAGFLTGKYTGDHVGDVPRARHVAPFFTARNGRILDAVREVAQQHDVAPATVALAWLLTRPTVAAPVASATSEPQLAALLAAQKLTLTDEDLLLLDAVSAPL